MNDAASITLIRATLATCFANIEDEDGDRNLSDTQACIEAISDIADDESDDAIAVTERLQRDDWITPETAAEIRGLANGH